MLISTTDVLLFLFILMVSAAVIVFGPILVWWAITTVFQLSTPLTFKTWLACLVIGSPITFKFFNKD